MSLRRKILLVMLAVSIPTLVGLAAYGAYSQERASGLQGRQRTALRRLLEEHLESVLRRELAALVMPADASAMQPVLHVRDLPLFQDPVVAALVRRAILVRFGSQGSASWFNLPRRFIFEEGSLDLEKALTLVRAAHAQGTIVESGDQLALPISVRGVPFGGIFVDVADEARRDAGGGGDGAQPLLLLTIATPGFFLLLLLVWAALSHYVIRPLEDLSRVAYAVSRGDYSRRLPEQGRADEIGRVTRAVNAMLVLVEAARDRMRERDQDLTERVERQQRQLVLGQRLAATGTLASGIAHEINNPLGGMLNAARRLRRVDLDPERRERYLGLIEDGVERIGKVVQQVLDLSPRRTTPGPIDVVDVIRRTAELVEHRAQSLSAKICLKTEVARARVLGEANAVGQIFLNLLINALDASPQGGEVRVLIDVTDQVTVVVEDDGSGMSPEVASRAFDLFFTTKEAGRGTGLGLATVHHLVRELGGDIGLQTAPGNGTRFTVRFPPYVEPNQE